MMNLLTLLPLLFIGLWIVQLLLAGIIHFSSKDIGLRKDYSLQPTVSVLISCYNEGRAIYDTIVSICQSDYPTDKFNVVVMDDCSTDNGESRRWIDKAVSDFPNVESRPNVVNRGKGRTILSAVQAATAEFIVTVDSDVILHKSALKEMMACFTSPKMGLVGGSVGISNPNENGLTVFQVYIYYIFFRLLKIPEAYFKSVACVSGCMSAIRRSVFLELVDSIEKRHWFGVSVRYGEDRFITHQTLLRGYDTYINLRAKCWTPAPDTFMGYWGQQLRWKRSSFADFCWTLLSMRENIRMGKPMALYTYFLAPTSLLVGVLGLTSLQNSLLSLLHAMIGVTVFTAVAISMINFFHREQKVHINPLRTSLYGTWGLIRTLFMVPAALFTLDSDGWGGVRESQLASLPGDNK
jgi:cellulose synthase/poly-beta-1,6-N-acetylglucosamine synthase-like glycosyltransferase